EQAGKLGVELTGAAGLMKTADFITLHVPLTEKTKHMLSKKEFAHMKRGVRIVNCSRGGVVDEAALLDALKKGHVAGAALDVFEKEPPVNNPLLALPNVIATPHLGAATEEAQTGVATDIAEQITDFFTDLPPAHAVNMPSVKPEVFATHRPYFLLAEKLGRFQAALLEGSVRSIQITYNGDFTGVETSLVSRYILVGFLKPTFGDYINFVNAPVLTRSRGIKITESVTDKKTKFTYLITATVTTSKKETTASGTLFNGEARIVQIDEYSIDLVPEGTVLIVHHKDRPGIIGRVGTLLGSHNINIAGMQVGRKTVRGDAVMALSVDDPVPPDVLSELVKLSGLTSARIVQF
ncbi:MAG: NAD(P)-dependent oxidoreductase, partial [bacterium]